MELKAGMWIAKGPEINVLLRVCGKSPLLEIKGAIDLKLFSATGKAKELDVSNEITDIYNILKIIHLIHLNSDVISFMDW